MNHRIISIFVLGAVVLPGFDVIAMTDDYPDAEQCQWPTTVYVLSTFGKESADYFGIPKGRCTGAYVGSGVVVTAGHCFGPGDTDEVTISFGEDGLDPVWSGLGDCVTHPGGQWLTGDDHFFLGVDIGFCIIDVDDEENLHPEPPIVPVMIPNGCEADRIRSILFDDEELAPGTYVGMGFSDDACTDSDSPPCDGRQKRFADGDIVFQHFSTNSLQQELVALQPDPFEPNAIPGVTHGDSGGPMYFAMVDGSRRLVGTISHRVADSFVTLPGDEEQTEGVSLVFLTPTPIYLRWIEVMSAQDVSPCHDWNGTTKKWDYVGGTGCGVGYEASPLSGAEQDWDDASGDITACAASDMLASETQCAGWGHWWSTSPPGWVTSRPAQTIAEGLLELATSGTNTARTLFELRGREEVYGSNGSDTLYGTSVADEIFMGPGNDYLVSAGNGNDEIHAGPGADVAYGDAGNDLFFPSYGRDEVYGGDGDDTVVILGSCEVESGEVYNGGGGGGDVLITPYTTGELTTLGVSVSNFEYIYTTHANAEDAACNPNAGRWPASG